MSQTELELPSDRHNEQSNAEQIRSTPQGHDDVTSLGTESSSSNESILSFLIQLHSAHNASPGVESALTVSQSDPNSNPQRGSISLDNVSVGSRKSDYLEPVYSSSEGSRKSEYIEPVYFSSTNVEPESFDPDVDSDYENPDPDVDSDYEKPDEKERIFVFTRSSLNDSESNDDQI